MSNCWLAVARDLIALGKDPDDAFTDALPLGQMVAIIVPSPPGTAVRWALDEGWTRTDHLLANLAEQWAGLTSLGRRHPRPGVAEEASRANQATRIETRPGRTSDKVVGFDSMTMEEWERVRAENWAREVPEGKTKRYAQGALL